MKRVRFRTDEDPRPVMRRRTAPALAVLLCLAPLRGQEAPATRPVSEPLAPFSIDVPPSTARIDMVPIPASPDGAVAPFWLGATEVTWDVYDVFAFGLDVAPGGGAADAVTRPTKPHIPPDRGLGHRGHPVISVTRRAAMEFCRWLSARTGRRFRLPTEAEWEHACRGPGGGRFAGGEDAAFLPDVAWFAANSGGKPHPVRTRGPGPWGLHDMHGNVAEWVFTDAGRRVAMGGSFAEAADAVAAGARAIQDRSWNRSDPNIPKSLWWLSDAPFVGFRVLCEPAPAEEATTRPGQGAKEGDR